MLVKPSRGWWAVPSDEEMTFNPEMGRFKGVDSLAEGPFPRMVELHVVSHLVAVQGGVADPQYFSLVENLDFFPFLSL